ncbi:GLPGLI family protein [Aquimarina megaterium]|uniref:GLPGLI family protein n=1 Tax=Aquimarina megaterium TaxID=1443666 RepID=UPI000945022E|nr:GLPGLI family protein [Aquimarina megaterium]
MKSIKYWILFFCLTSPWLSNSQHSGMVTYQKRMTQLISETPEAKKMAKEKPRYYKTMADMDHGMQLLLEDMEFKLFFKENQSIFKAETTLEHEKNKLLRGALGYGLGTGLYYMNGNEKKGLHQIDMIGQTFIVKSEKINWQLSNESKKIGKYTCYKATYIEKTKAYGGKIHEKEVVAWYTPDISIPFGPVGYGNLPGLIIMLDYGGIVEFVVKRIDLNPKKEINIKKPEKGEWVTEKELKERVDRIMDNMRN